MASGLKRLNKKTAYIAVFYCLPFPGFVAAEERSEAAFEREAVVNSAGAFRLDARNLMVYDGFAVARSLAALLSDYRIEINSEAIKNRP